MANDATRFWDTVPRWVSQHLVEITTWLLHRRRRPVPTRLQIKVHE